MSAQISNLPVKQYSPFWRWILTGLLLLVIVLNGYPVAFVTHHGLAPASWPPSFYLSPNDWYTSLLQLNFKTIVLTYFAMAHGTVGDLPEGGYPDVAIIASISCVSALLGFFGWIPTNEARSASSIYGSSNWATDRELAALRAGVEIGINPTNGRPVRIKIESNLLTIAPSRSGKSTGFVQPNLACVDQGAWHGPVVIIDPKGEAYAAAVKRRGELGRRVVCLDPLSYVGGQDRWNPLRRVDANDVLKMQSVARALLPRNNHSDSSASQFFSNTAADLLVAAMIITVRDGHPNPTSAADLIDNEDRFIALLKDSKDPTCRAALRHLRGDRSKEDAGETRQNILSTATQATQWLRDEKMRSIVREHTFEMTDLTNGDLDLFIVIPPDSRKEILAPYVRWLLTDLFQAFREKRAVERLLVIIDEAFSLGNFEEILHGVAELPGHLVSLWTIWQSRSQIIQLFGEHGANQLIDNAQVVNLFNLTRANPDELEHWSQAIGTYTANIITTSADIKNKNETKSTTLAEVRLVHPNLLPELLKTHQIVFLNGRELPTSPLKLLRTRAHEDRRFSGLLSLAGNADHNR